MFLLWMCLSVLYVLLCRVSGDEGVSLVCPRNVTVRRGDPVTLNCSIIWHEECTNEPSCYSLINGSEKHRWPCCNETYMLRKIMDKAMKEENVTVSLHTSWGMDGSTIEVQVTEQIPTEQTPTQSKGEKLKENPEAKPHGPYIVVAVFVVAVLGMLAFLFKTSGWAKINKLFRDVLKGHSSRQQPEDHRSSVI